MVLIVLNRRRPRGPSTAVRASEWTMGKLFSNRAAAGQALARVLSKRHWGGSVVVLAQPRGGAPVAPTDTLVELAVEVDEIVCLAEPSPFHAVGLHDGDFHRVEDSEVIATLAAARSKRRE
jgi:putative phosphoribosyl transferase